MKDFMYKTFKVARKLSFEVFVTCFIITVLFGFSAAVSVADEKEQTDQVDIISTVSEISITNQQTTEVYTTTQISTTEETTTVRETTRATTVARARANAAKGKTARKTTSAATTTSTTVVESDEDDSVQSDASSNGMILKGNFRLTFYCGCSSCNGKWAGKTSSGAPMVEGRTIAVDTSVIPMGTSVYIEGMGWYVAEDTGSAIKGKKIDVYISDHDRCKSMGVKYRDVYVKG